MLSRTRRRNLTEIWFHNAGVAAWWKESSALNIAITVEKKVRYFSHILPSLIRDATSALVKNNSISLLLGHIRRDCTLPNLRQTGHGGVVVFDAVPGSSIVCYNCGKGGHLRKDCQEEKMCYNCKQKGHLAVDCPEEERCSSCGQIGHRKADCGTRKSCFVCGQPGHLAKNCVERSLRPKRPSMNSSNWH